MTKYRNQYDSYKEKSSILLCDYYRSHPNYINPKWTRIHHPNQNNGRRRNNPQRRRELLDIPFHDLL